MNIGRGTYAVLAVLAVIVLLLQAVIPGFSQSPPRSTTSAPESVTYKAWQASVDQFEQTRVRMREAENEHFWKLFKPMQQLKPVKIAEIAEDPSVGVREAPFTIPAGYTGLLQKFLENKAAKEFLIEVDNRTGECVLGVLPIVKYDTPQPVPHRDITVAEFKKLNGAYIGLMLITEHKDHSLLNVFRLDDGAELHVVLKTPRIPIDTPPEKIAELTDIWNNPGFAKFFQYEKSSNKARYQPLQFKFSGSTTRDTSRDSF